MKIGIFLCLIMKKYIIKRVLILIVPIVLLNIYHFATFDEHKRCVNNLNRHIEGYFGIAFLTFLWLTLYGGIFLISIISEFIKRKKSKV